MLSKLHLTWEMDLAPSRVGVPKLGSIPASQRQERAGGTDTPCPGALALMPLPCFVLFLDFLKLFSALPPAVLRRPRGNPTLTKPPTFLPKMLADASRKHPRDFLFILQNSY